METERGKNFKTIRTHPKNPIDSIHMSLENDLEKNRERFDELYAEVRSIIIRFQLESPKAPVYASGFLESIRNAHDDCIYGYRNKELNKIANAVEHLTIAGCEALELILLDKMKEILDIHNQINFFLWRAFYPEETFSLIHNNMIYARDKLILGKTYKSKDFHKSKKAYEEGIKKAENVLSKFYSKQIPGLYRAEKRISYFVAFSLGVLSGVIAGVIIGLAL